MTRSFLFSSDGQLRWYWQLLFYFPVMLGVTVLVVGPAIWLALKLGWLPAPGESIETWGDLLALVVFRYLFLFAGVLWGTHLAQRWLRRNSLGGLGLWLHSGWLGQLGLGCLLGLVMMLVSAGLAWMMGWYRPLGFAWQFRPLDEWFFAVVRHLMIQVQAGLLEELIFRGYLLQVLEKRFGLRIAVPVSAALFALSHLSNAEQDYPIWVVLFSITVAGLVFAQAYLHRRSLWTAVGLHFASDWFIGLLGTVGSLPQDALLVATQVNGPALLQGPQFAGLGVFDVLGLGMVALLLYISRKRSGLI